MGTVIHEKEAIWIRCWDGTEMEYEQFSIEEVVLAIGKMDNRSFALSVGAVHDIELERVLNKLRDDDREADN